MSDPFAAKVQTPLDCVLTRDQVITRINVLAETHLMSMKNTVADEVFESVADFPVELINNSVNGYQRFLTDISGSGGDSAAIIAGFILRFKTAIVYEFGTAVIDGLKDEVFVKMNDQQYTEAFGKEDMPTLWGVANPKLEKTPVNRDYDMIATWLFINNAKWLIVRVGAALDEVNK
ncbi:hypothetical protein BIZ83_gp017 [Erwinia phage vB_EamM_ChrisDB]|uniref:hypothetical protein n=1 Tax=Erwinia phage vB_EamM_ChrisDB TaxID=1883371 RepID=UPI00081C866D|nr:hypothetical protein BIZ83_gp017 [Erwinia phage vB_EamM_ChrisDB]ANZ48836.1 hypothetical protein CHRISDB_274 [Erwinia phage vB_EamM_ChrisDB]